MSRTENPQFGEMSATPPSLQISVSRQAYDWRLRLDGDLDMETTRYLHAAFSRVAAQPGQDVFVDLNDTTFCDCAGLTALVDEQRRLGRDGVTLVIENPPRLVRRLLAITGLDEVLSVRP
jgi:anti-anti-sigma factor